MPCIISLTALVYFRCPHCDFAAIMDPGDKVFRCQAINCKKVRKSGWPRQGVNLGLFLYQSISCEYSKSPKFCTPECLTKVAYANSADPDQTAPERAV